MSDTGHPSTLGRRVRNGTNRPPTLITRHVRIGSKAGTFVHYSLWYAGELRLRERQRHCRFGFLVKHATSGRQKNRRSMARYRRCDTAFAEQNLLARVIILRFAGECRLISSRTGVPSYDKQDCQSARRDGCACRVNSRNRTQHGAIRWWRWRWRPRWWRSRWWRRAF